MTRPCVLLLPGLLCDGAVWSAQREALAFADCVVPSYGELSSLADMARSVLDVVPAGRFSLAGQEFVAMDSPSEGRQRSRSKAHAPTGCEDDRGDAAVAKAAQ